jgi:hypothetical protein
MKRRTLIGGIAAAGAVLVAGLYRFTDLFVRHYPPTPYDDVLAALVDRESAIAFGALVRGAPAPDALAVKLRGILKTNGLTGAAKSDIAAGRLVEVDGWVVPESVALLSALAAKV